jgi:ATP-dependent helicase/nuclease subunit B
LSHRLFDTSVIEPLVEKGCVILTPNYRLARRIKAEWDRQMATRGPRAWHTLQVEPLESWLLGQWDEAVGRGLLPPLTPLDEAQALVLWRQVIAEEEASGGAPNLLRPAAAAELASRAREDLLRWQVDLTEETVRQLFRYDADCAAFLAWRDRFEALLTAEGLCTRSDCLRALVDCPPDLSRPGAVLVDFDEIPPLLNTALQNISQEVQALETGGDQARCVARGFSGRRAELQAVARWAFDVAHDEPDATLGIVLADMDGDRGPLEYLLRREFGCLGENYNALPVNFSTGISLDRAPVVRDALAVLALAQGEARVPTVVDLLQSRFLDLPDAGSPLVQRFINRLFEGGRAVLSTGALRHAATGVALGEQRGTVLGQHLLKVSGLRDLRRPSPPSAWVERFVEVLSIWGWPGAGPLDSLEYQQVELWYRTLDEFRALDGVCGEVDYGAALGLLRDACTRQVSQPQTADSRVQVLGALEAVGLAFDHLWLCGLQGGSWPAPARPNPLVPLSLQRSLQMPHATAEREWMFYSGLMHQYRCSAGTLRASYSRQLDGIPELPSSLLSDFSWEQADEPPTIAPDWVRRWRQRSVERFADHTAPPLDPDDSARSGGSRLLEDQSQCPFRAFARHRLAVDALGEFSVALSAADRGSLLHDALFALWGEIGDHARLMSMDDDTERAVVRRAVRAAVEAVSEGRRRALGSAYWTLEEGRLADLLGEWLKVERQRGAFVVAQRERDIELELEQLQIRLRVDRIDELPDGSQVIVDYKSGKSSVNDWQGDRPARPQLLLYGLAAPANPAALAFAQVRPRESRYVGLGAVAAAPGIKVVEEWEAQNAQWRGALARLARDFAAGAAAVDPLTQASCTWCGLQPLCRVGQREVKSP